MPDRIIQLKDSDGNKVYPLTSASLKKDYANAVDLTNLSSYTVPKDGIIEFDTGERFVNKGEVWTNAAHTAMTFVPFRYVCHLPEETDASDIPCTLGGTESNVQNAITSLNASLANIRNGNVSLKIAYSNYGNTLSFKGHNDGNMQGIIIGGTGSSSNTKLCGFSYRPASTTISFTDNSFSGSCDESGNITVNCPVSAGWTVIYIG